MPTSGPLQKSLATCAVLERRQSSDAAVGLPGLEAKKQEALIRREQERVYTEECKKVNTPLAAVTD